MNPTMTFEAHPFVYESADEDDPESEAAADFDSRETFEEEVAAAARTPTPLPGPALTEAITANRHLARRFGWACVVGGRLQPIAEVLTLLGLISGVSEEDFARAVARWQVSTLRQPGSGRLDGPTWVRMQRRNVLPASRFQPASFPVHFGGRILGVLDKTAPYRKCFYNPGPHSACRPVQSGVANESGGAEIQFGFRVTDPEAAVRAGFADRAGDLQFRWIQVIELRRIGGPAEPVLQALRKRGQGHIIDPTTALLPVDRHPYYWYEDLPSGVPAGFHIRNYLNRPGPNRLCYDLHFYDRPRIPFGAALPGRRAYFNFETALVGVRPGSKNVILNTFLWGFDIIHNSKTPALKFNVLRPGTTGGSTAMRRVLSREIETGSFPGHCFTNSGFSTTARCA